MILKADSLQKAIEIEFHFLRSKMQYRQGCNAKQMLTHFLYIKILYLLVEFIKKRERERMAGSMRYSS